jgi:hypothetical protein
MQKGTAKGDILLINKSRMSPFAFPQSLLENDSVQANRRRIREQFESIHGDLRFV